GNRKKTLTLNPGTYRLRMGIFTSSHGFWGSNSQMGVQYRADLIQYRPPEIKTSTLSFTEGKNDYGNINISGGEGDFTCSNPKNSKYPLLTGMKLVSTSNGCQIRWKPGYDVNNSTNTGSKLERVTVSVSDSRDQKDTKTLNIYVRNKPFSISNVRSRDYKQISDLPSPTINYEKPSVPLFDSSGSLSSQVNLTKLTSYTFESVEETPPHPGDTPNMLASKESSLVYGTNNQIDSSLRVGDVKGYRKFEDQLIEYNGARNAYENLEEFLNKQYGDEEKENTKRFDKGLEDVVEYNNKNNNLGKKVAVEDYKDYKNMEEVYEALKNQLAERQRKMDHNNEQYNKYQEKVEKYNKDMEKEVEEFINQFKTNYLNQFNDWKNEKEDYLNSLQSLIDSYNSHNQKLYDNKKDEINNAINKYGLVSLQVSQITKRPKLNDYYSTQNNHFDNSKVPNIYDSIKNYSYLSSTTKNQIKSLFNDRIYTDSKYSQLKNLMVKDLKVNIENLLEHNEEYLLK
ncbi:MAG: hypothetical protein ACOCUI_02760, partial [bacterium]